MKPHTAVVLIALAVCGASASQPARHLLQADPFTVFNEPAGPPSVAAGAPSVNLNGIGATAASATTVPVLGTLAAPLPSTAYAAGYAPAAVGGVSVAAPVDPYAGAYAPAAAGYAPAAAGYAPVAPGAAAIYPAGYAQPAAGAVYAPAPAVYAPALPAAPAYDPIAAAAGVTMPGMAAAAAPLPAGAAAPIVPPVERAPAPAPAPPPARPPPPLPPGMVPRSQMKEQIPANASALPTIKVPEGTTAKLAYVCDISGQLYIAVNRNGLIICPSDNMIQLAKISGIKGAKSITCPDNRLACPGNYAVNIITKLNNTIEEFRKVVPQWRANVATAASVRIDRVVITDVEILIKPSTSKQTSAGGKIAPLRRMLQVEDTAAVVETTKPRKGSNSAAVEDTAATIEEIELPKARIIVTTTIQPLTEMEAMSVYGTTKSPYFDSTFVEGSKKMGMVFVDGYTTEQSDPGEEFDFPEPEGTAKKPKPTVAKKSADAADLDATTLSAVELTAEEKAAKAAAEAEDAAALANANVTAPANETTTAKSGAARPAAAMAAQVAAAALLVVAAVVMG